MPNPPYEKRSSELEILITRHPSRKSSVLPCGTRDNKIEEYVGEFLLAVNDTVQLCRESLLAEVAEADPIPAESTLRSLQERVEQHRRTAKALRKLLDAEEGPLPVSEEIH